MTDRFVDTSGDRPLHDLMSGLLGTERPLAQKQPSIPGAGTLQLLNQRLERYPVLDFVNYSLRGIGQVIFVNNPISGTLILLALLIQSPWVGMMGGLGVVASTVTALIFRLDRATIRNGIFGYNGLLVGAALATFGDRSVGAGGLGWAIAVIGFAALTTVLMKTFGVWWAKTVKTPPLTLPFNMATLLALALVPVLPGLTLVDGSSSLTPVPLSWPALGTALPISFGQVFLADRLISGLLVVLAVGLCTPLGALVGLLGAGIGTLSGLLLGIPLELLYVGLFGYNAVLCAMAIGGVFYAPTRNSIVVGAIAALLSTPVTQLLGWGFGRLSLPVLTVPFCVVTIAAMVFLARSLPSLVPVALHAITSPEEHRQRYQAAKTVITNFRHQLTEALSQHRRFYLFEHVSPAIKGDLRYLFNRIDQDQSETLSTLELSAHLRKAGQVTSEDELAYLFGCMDRDRSGTINFEEFSELMLRHRRLMANYSEFVTYFLPIDANGDDAISWDEMNVAMASVGEPQLSSTETAYLSDQTRGKALTWNHFVEMLLVT